MLDVKTPLSKIHRPVRPIDSSYLGPIGVWSYINSTGFLTRIASNSTDQHQPQVLKLCFRGSSSVIYETNDVKGGRISTLEGVFRAAVDNVGYQEYDTAGNAINYIPGMLLTPAYRITSTPNASDQYAVAADIGKLRPASQGDLIVASVDNFVGGILTFRSHSPQPFGGDDIWEIRGTGRLVGANDSVAGSGSMYRPPVGSGILIDQSDVIDGTGAYIPTDIGSGSLIDQNGVMDGTGTRTPGVVPGPDRGAYEY